MKVNSFFGVQSAYSKKIPGISTAGGQVDLEDLRKMKGTDVCGFFPSENPSRFISQ